MRCDSKLPAAVPGAFMNSFEHHQLVPWIWFLLDFKNSSCDWPSRRVVPSLAHDCDHTSNDLQVPKYVEMPMYASMVELMDGFLEEGWPLIERAILQDGQSNAPNCFIKITKADQF